jgi:formylglycine-generating enzyme required for sulfatase activity
MSCHVAVGRSQVLVMLALGMFSGGATGSLAVAAETPATVEIVNSLGMKFRTIPAGEFVMGATPDEIAERSEQLAKRGDDENGDEIRRDEIATVKSEGPQHRVTITKEFRLGVYEVTQQEFQAVMGFNPSAHSATGTRQDWLAGLDTRRHPVDQVSWNDAVEFCRQLSSLEEEVAAGRSYRLPTEAEWEYACRAGTTTKFFWGDEKGKKATAWTKYPKLGTAPRATTVPAGSLEPNPWGLYDMTGNVREWCADWYDAGTYARGAAVDPRGPATGVERVVRGGMNYFFAPAYRSAARRKLSPDAVNLHVGMRIVCVQGPVPQAVPKAALLAQLEAQLKQKGLVRRGTLFVPAEEAEFARFTTTLERMRAACFGARREVDDAKKQLQRISTAEAGALRARVEARNMMRYSETWREHRNGVVSRNLAADALALVNMSREDVERWLADAEADYELSVARFAEQCETLRAMHDRLNAKQTAAAADAAVKQALAAASAGGKTTYRVGSSSEASASLKKLAHEESVLRQLRGG